MAITIVKLGEDIVGSRRKVWGTYTVSGGATGGDISTGLQHVEYAMVTATGSSVVADAPTINETFPLASGDVTVIATADTAGIWEAYGY